MTADAAPKPTPLMIRGVDMGLWRQVRAEGVRRGQSAGAHLNEILRRELARLESERRLAPRT